MLSQERRSLLSSRARIQVPWVKVTIGAYTFGIFSKQTREHAKDNNGFYTAYNVQYPNYIDSLNIVKINGQVNQYTLGINYPIRVEDDPNFFEKIFSSVSKTRKIVFSYGDANQPAYIYKDEEAIITKVSQTFSLESSTIKYTVSAISGAALTAGGSYTFVGGRKKPSDEIKKIFRNPKYKLGELFTGMSEANLDKLIDGSDQEVDILTKTNISILDYLTYLVSCMIPRGQPINNISKDIYILTLHDDTSYDDAFFEKETANGVELTGPYFKVTKINYISEHSDAYNIDIGYNTSTIVSSFSLENNENYSLLYDYEMKDAKTDYVQRLNNQGEWEQVYAPAITSKTDNYMTYPDDITWWTKITKYPINATITIQGLLRPATLMTYVRLNVIFPGGHKHISSGLYIVTKQTDTINGSGYKTTLNLTKINGD